MHEQLNTFVKMAVGCNLKLNLNWVHIATGNTGYISELEKRVEKLESEKLEIMKVWLTGSCLVLLYS